MSRWVVAALALYGCHAQPAVPSPRQSFDIRIHHTVRVGDTWRVIADGEASEASSTYTEQVALKKTDKHERVHFDARAVAREVDAFFPTRVEYTISEFSREGRSILPAGKRVIVTVAPKREDAKVDVDGQSAIAAVRESLDAAIPLAHGPGTEDMVFGTTERQTVGASWDVNAGAMQAELARNDVTVAPDAMHGKVTLAGIERTGGVDCLHLHVELKVDAFGLIKPLPDGSQITKGHIAFRADFFMPIDGSSRRKDVIEAHTDFEAFIPTESAEVAGVTVEHHDGHRRVTNYER